MDAPAITRRRFTTDEYEQIVAAGVFAEDEPNPRSKVNVC